MIVVVPCDTTGYQCKSTCDGQPDGDYQWCRSCNNFISCWNYNTYVHVCEECLVYDANIKRFAKKSDTCICSYEKCRFCRYSDGNSCSNAVLSCVYQNHIASYKIN